MGFEIIFRRFAVAVCSRRWRSWSRCQRARGQGHRSRPTILPVIARCSYRHRRVQPDKPLAASGRSGVLAAAEIHYGLIPNLEVDIGMPYNFNFPTGGSAQRGYGDTTLEVKYRLIQESDTTPQVSFVPKLNLSTGNANRGLGNGGNQLFIALRAAKEQRQISNERQWRLLDQQWSRQPQLLVPGVAGAIRVYQPLATRDRNLPYKSASRWPGAQHGLQRRRILSLRSPKTRFFSRPEEVCKMRQRRIVSRPIWDTNTAFELPGTKRKASLVARLGLCGPGKFAQAGLSLTLPARDTRLPTCSLRPALRLHAYHMLSGTDKTETN